VLLVEESVLLAGPVGGRCRWGCLPFPVIVLDFCGRIEGMKS